MRLARVLPSRPAASALLVALGVLAALLLTVLPRAGASLGALEAQPPVGESVAEGVVRQTRSYGPAGLENTYDVYLPAHEPVRRRPTVVFLHGGSWEIGDKVEWVAEATAVARRGWTAVAVNYRRTATAPWPAPLVDVRAALADLQGAADDLGVDPQRTGALGDSVGGQLAALVGRPAPGLVPVRSVVTWSGVDDLPGLLAQPSSGGCATTPCAYRGLARKAVSSLMGCVPAACPAAYRDASPAARLAAGAATFAVNSETELIDPRQAWVMDAALSRARVPSRVLILRGDVHGRGYQPAVWGASLRFLAATLTPETAPAYPRPAVTVTLDAAARQVAPAGTPLRLSGTVQPRATGSTVAVQRLTPGGAWRTVRLAPLVGTATGTAFRTSVVPPARGTSTWRVRWRGGGGLGSSRATTVTVR